jgi:cbb3-type cytochrome oxidase maturation protein
VDILFLLIPLSVVLVFAIGAVFWFALRSGQFDEGSIEAWSDRARLFPERSFRCTAASDLT